MLLRGSLATHTVNASSPNSGFSGVRIVSQTLTMRVFLRLTGATTGGVKALSTGPAKTAKG